VGESEEGGRARPQHKLLYISGEGRERGGWGREWSNVWRNGVFWTCV